MSDDKAAAAHQAAETARLQHEDQVLSAVANFMGVLGMRPPVDRQLFPPLMPEALTQLVADLREAFDLPPEKQEPAAHQDLRAPAPAPHATATAARPADRK